MKNTIVITRHEALVDYLREIGLIDDDTPIIPHATPDDVRNRIVIGPVPLHLAVLAYATIQIPLDIPHEMRGVELTIDQVREFAGTPVAYRIEPLTVKKVECGYGHPKSWALFSSPE